MKMLPLLCALLLSLPATAQERSEGAPAQADPVLLTEGFLHHHPDIRYRQLGIDAYRDGFKRDAHTLFRKAAWYADKASQAMLAEMYWKGEGVPQDRALAYAWMDLAAERRYPAFLLLRERYWSQLDEAERARALEVGRQIYAEYEDAVAKPRLERKLERGRRQITGSRVGARGALQILIPGPGGMPISVTGEQYYTDKYWQPRDYWRWTDTIWSAPPRGRVDVGELEKVRTEDGK